MMRVLGKVVLAVAVAALLGTPVWAQRGGAMFGGLGLLNSEAVQKELKLSDDQKQKLETLTKEFREKHKEEISNLQGLEPKEQAEAFAKLHHEGMQEVKPVLDKEQFKRFRQIDLQVRGVQALNDPHVQKHLKLTDKQKEEIKTLGEEARNKGQEIRQNAEGDRAAAFKKIIALHKETLDKATKVLTEEQVKTWKEMTGKPFEFSFGGGRGRRRGNG